MKKLDKFMDSIDKRVDRAIGPSYRYVRKYFTVFSVSFLVVLMAFVCFKFFYTKPYFIAQLIKADLYRLEETLHKIDNSCQILHLATERAPINFLTVKDFTGSMVGDINLVHPRKWQGPYLQQTPTIQGRAYELVKAQDGYFVVPGNGVLLPNGVTMGRDLVISPEQPLAKALQPGGMLCYKGLSLGVKINFNIGDWHLQAPVITPAAEQKKKEPARKSNVNQFLEEFSAAMPFTQHEQQVQLVTNQNVISHGVPS